MTKPIVLIKAAAVVSALLLAGGFVSYRSGAFNGLMGPSATQPTPDIMGGSKIKTLVGPSLPTTPEAQPPDAAKPAGLLMSGSKSLVLPSLIPNPVATPPSNPSTVDLVPVGPAKPPSDTAPPKSPIIIPSPKAGPIFVPPSKPPDLPPPTPAQPSKNSP